MPDGGAIRVAPGGFRGYTLLDSGDRLKLERFGPVTVIRGEPKAWWSPRLPRADWDRADAVHDEDLGWRIRSRIPREWTLDCEGLRILARISDTSKHLGIFPEQSPHWRAIRAAAAGARAPDGAPPRLLNIFGYTGAATLAAAQSGWRATHVDASKPAIAWGRENQRLSGLSDAPIRWILEDAVKYVQREVRRGSRYEGIILDPPAFGRSPTGKVWKVEHHLADLLSLCRQALSDRPRLLILTTYNIEASALMLKNLLADTLHNLGGTVEAGELVLPHASDPARLLPLSIYARWQPA